MIRVFMIGYSENKGGVESYITNLASNLSKSEFEIIYSMPEMSIDGKMWRCPRNRHNYLLYRLFWKRFYNETGIDVVYYNVCDVVSIDQLRFAKAAGVPVRIIHSHSTGNQQGIEKKLSLFHRLSEKQSRRVLDRYATHFLACSEVAGKWMFDGRSFTVIKNGISLPKYRYSEAHREKIRAQIHAGMGKLVGIIGRVSPPKNPLFTVQILEQYLRAHPDDAAVFVGDGELREETEKAVREAGLAERVRFVGAVDNVNEWMSAVDCLLMPSLFEGLPFVLVEAQAAGLPCVVSSAVSEEANLSGELKYVGLDEPLSVWAEAVEQAVNRPRYDAEQKLIAAGYSIEDSAKEVTELIENALKGHERR